mmetsp:Transcript_28670/g.60814  ORF Transcript_28670/g.60814 Transcript_28670/m.60814 type:complete len:201 (-) Transcript_28670:619-1221(-)
MDNTFLRALVSRSILRGDQHDAILAVGRRGLEGLAGLWRVQEHRLRALEILCEPRHVHCPTRRINPHDTLLAVRPAHGIILLGRSVVVLVSTRSVIRMLRRIVRHTRHREQSHLQGVTQGASRTPSVPGRVWPFSWILAASNRLLGPHARVNGILSLSHCRCGRRAPRRPLDAFPPRVDLPVGRFAAGLVRPRHGPIARR